jgi:hypothetical protein
MPDVLDDLETYWAAATRDRSHLDGRELIDAADAPLILSAEPDADSRRKRWRVLSVAAAVIAAIAVAALLLTDHDERADRIGVANDQESTDGSVTTVDDDGHSTGETRAIPDSADEEIHPPPPIGSIPDASLEGHPQQSFLENDPEGQELADAFRHQREIGWYGVQLTPELVGWIPLEFAQTRRMGSVSEVANNDGDMVGYYIAGLGYADTETFKSPAFDWRAWAREIEWFSPEQIEEKIASIEEQGGLSDVYRIPDLTP